MFPYCSLENKPYAKVDENKVKNSTTESAYSLMYNLITKEPSKVNDQTSKDKPTNAIGDGVIAQYSYENNQVNYQYSSWNNRVHMLSPYDLFRLLENDWQVSSAGVQDLVSYNFFEEPETQIQHTQLEHCMKNYDFVRFIQGKSSWSNQLFGLQFPTNLFIVTPLIYRLGVALQNDSTQQWTELVLPFDCRVQVETAHQAEERRQMHDMQDNETYLHEQIEKDELNWRMKGMVLRYDERYSGKVNLDTLFPNNSGLVSSTRIEENTKIKAGVSDSASGQVFLIECKIVPARSLSIKALTDPGCSVICMTNIYRIKLEDLSGHQWTPTQYDTSKSKWEESRDRVPQLIRQNCFNQSRSSVGLTSFILPLTTKNSMSIEKSDSDDNQFSEYNFVKNIQLEID